MRFNSEKLIFLSSIFSIVCLYIFSPTWFSLQGVGPSWSVLWLLPWSLCRGKIFGLFSGLCLGLFLDSLSVGFPTQMPALICLGFWWGHVGTQGKPIESGFNLGLLALIGAMFSGLTYWAQNLFVEGYANLLWFHSWAFHTLLAQSILTALIAPLFCGWILLLVRNKK